MNPSSIGMIVGAALTALAGSGAGWLARGLMVDHVEIPRIIKQQAEICTLTTEAVAAKATRDEQLRQFQIGERATQSFIEQSKAAADDAQAERDMLEMEIQDYAQREQETGRACALDAADLELLGLRNKPGGALPGSSGKGQGGN